ncbi:MAG: hypothetical protein IJO39_10645 [Clostridia bacterium]|nr:hypothetical protein [Clostridia bacterium]
MQNKLFKKSSVERFSSPEKLNDYIQVSNPSSWMVLAAALALLLGVLAWGLFGEMTQSESFSGVMQEGKLQCYVSSAVSAALEPGMEVTIAPMTAREDVEIVGGKVLAIASRPLSYDEVIKDVESDYLQAALGISSWNIAVEIAPDEALYDGMVYVVSVVTETQRPIDLIFQ